MDVEKVKVLTVLKCGTAIYKKGQVFSEPIPNDLILEVRENTGTVEVLSRRTSPVPDKTKQEEKPLDPPIKDPAPELELLKDTVESPEIEKKVETVKDEKVEKPEKPKQVAKKRTRIPQKKKKVVRSKK